MNKIIDIEKHKNLEGKEITSDIPKYKPVNAKDIFLKRNEFSATAQNFMKTEPGFVLKGPIFIIFLVVIAALFYSFIAKVQSTVTSAITVTGEEYLVQSPVVGSVSSVFKNENDLVQEQMELMTLLSESLLITESGLEELKDELQNIKQDFNEINYAIKRIEEESKVYSKKNSKFRIIFSPKDISNFEYDSDLSALTTINDTIWTRSEYYHLLQRTAVRMNELWVAYNRSLNLQNKQNKIYNEDLKLFEKEIITEYQMAASHERFIQLSEATDGYLNAFKMETYGTMETLIDKSKNLYQRYKELKAQIDQTLTLEDEVVIKDRICLLKSRYPGVVAEVYVNAFQYVMQGTVMMKIIRTDLPLNGILYITDQYIGTVQVGQNVGIKFDAYPYQDYGIQTGKVISISPDAKLIDGLGYVYEADIVYDKINPKINMIYGMRGSAEIYTGEKRLIETIFEPISKVFNYIDGDD